MNLSDGSNIEKLPVDKRTKLLGKLRKKVDLLDRILVYLLNKRTSFAVKIGSIKTSLGQPTYVPERERDIMQRINKINKGPLSQESLERIYERILDQSRATQKAESSKLSNDNLNDNKKKSPVKGLLTKRDYYIVFSAFIIVMGILLYTFFSPNYYKTEGPVQFEIQSGETLTDVINTLYDYEIIPSKRNMRIAAFVYGADRKIKAGRYKIPNGLSYVSLLDLLIKGEREIPALVVLPEGLTINQMAGILSKSLAVDSSSFVKLCNEKKLLDSLGIKANSLEGYLIPDSYYFYYNTPPGEIISKLRREFEQLLVDSVKQKINDLGYSLHEVLTMASIVEGETNKIDEFPLIAGVYYNRLKAGMKLQADPTVQYVLRSRWRRLLNRDLMIDSPYNTYIYYGLPPGPINCPGRDAILAAIYPARHNYLYFVADGNGGHVFSSNYNNHLKAVQKYRIWLRSQQAIH